MADFLKIVNFIIDENEKGLQYHYDDGGNWRGEIGVGLNLGTKYGITGKTMTELYSKLSDEQIKAKIKNLTKEEAIKIYEKGYWKPGRFAKIENDSIAYQFFDHYINIGNGGLGGLVERLNHKYGFFVFRVKRRYKIHPFAKDSFSDAEIKSINANDSPQFYQDIQQARVAYYSRSPKYEAHKKRVSKWKYEKKKPKQEPFRYDNPFNNWLRYSFNEEFKL